MASIITSNVSRTRPKNIREQTSQLSKKIYHKKRMAGENSSSSNNIPFGINSVLETMDRFLENNDGNHLVQLFVHLENRTSVSRKSLARFLLAIVVCYFLFSVKIFDLSANILLYFLPSYGTYVFLQKPDSDIQKQDLIHICRYWVFAGFFITVDPALTLILPFWSFIKVFLAFQCFLPRRSALVNTILDTVVARIFSFLKNNSSFMKFNQFIVSSVEEPHQE